MQIFAHCRRASDWLGSHEPQSLIVRTLIFPSPCFRPYMGSAGGISARVTACIMPGGERLLSCTFFFVLIQTHPHWGLGECSVFGEETGPQ